MSASITEIDIRILDILQHDCGVNYERMSEIVGRSPTSCLRRVKNLEKQGYIKSRNAVLNETALGFDLTAIFLIELSQDVIDIDKRLEKIVKERAEIQQCFVISSGADFMFIAKFKNTNEYKDFVFNIIEIFDGLMVREYDSHFVVREICDRRTLPISK